MTGVQTCALPISTDEVKADDKNVNETPKRTRGKRREVVGIEEAMGEIKE